MVALQLLQYFKLVRIGAKQNDDVIIDCEILSVTRLFLALYDVPYLAAGKRLGFLDHFSVIRKSSKNDVGNS